MSIAQRRFIRFSLDLPATRFAEDGRKVETRLEQISVGGCMLAWDEKICTGDEFRMELQLPNGNTLPLKGKALYRFNRRGIGVRFLNICQFEQDILAHVIAGALDKEGVPLLVDPFATVPVSTARNPQESFAKKNRLEEEEKLEEILSLEV
jgi:hypothetical protein